MHSLPSRLNFLRRTKSTYGDTTIKLLDINGFPFFVALSHNVRRVLDNSLYHGRKVVKSFFREQWTDDGAMDLMFMRIAGTDKGGCKAQVFVEGRRF